MPPAESLSPLARRLVHLRAGSHLYGTATPASDLDAKAVFLPAAADILLQRAPATLATSARPGAPNRPGDLDTESWSLQRYLELLAAGQPIAIEVLFAPDAAMLEPPDPIWREVQALGPRLLTRGAGVFLSYGRQQAAKYGAKGERAAAARQALATLGHALATHGNQARLATIEPTLAQLASGSPHIDLVDIPSASGRPIRHFHVSGRRAPFTASLATARAIMAKLVAEFGARSEAASAAGGTDWKALSHAVRVGREAIEYLGTGRLVFPLASAPRLLAIKQGRVPLPEIEAEIDALVGEVECAAAASPLPEAPDLAAAEHLVLRAYRAVVMQSANLAPAPAP